MLYRYSLLLGIVEALLVIFSLVLLNSHLGVSIGLIVIAILLPILYFLLKFQITKIQLALEAPHSEPRYGSAPAENDELKEIM